jgi:MFS family permease
MKAPTDNYELYRRRWLVLSSFSLLSCSNAIIWITYAPWTLEAADYWNVTPAWINNMSLVYMLVFVIGVFPASAFVSRFGIRNAVFLGGLLNLAGAWLRFAGAGSGSTNFFSLQAPGQTLCAVAQTFLLGAPARVSAEWFGARERTRSTAIMALCNQAGIGVGFLLAPAIVGSDPSHEVGNLMLIEAIVACAAVAAVLAFFRERPPTPPSASAGFSDESSGIPFRASVAMLAKNFQFWLLCAAFGIGVGSFYALSTLLDQLTEPSGYSSGDAGWFGFILVTVGIAAAMFVSYLGDRTKQFRLLLLLAFIGLLGSLIWFSAQAVRRPRNMATMIACCSAMGAFSSALLPLAFEVAAEISYPVNAELGSNVILCLAQIFGIGLTTAVNGIAEIEWVDGIQNASYVLSVGVLAATVAMVAFRPKYSRAIVESLDSTSPIDGVATSEAEES